VARRFPRRATAAVAAGCAVACVALAATPAFADQVRNQEWWLAALHVTTAWESSKGSGVTVAVLDTGVDPAQADLTGSVTTGPDYTASGRKSGGTFWGIHGTAIASLIAGHGHGAKGADGIIGVAPAAKILSVRVTLEGNDPLLATPRVAAALPGAIAKGIRYAVSQGVGVIDLPLDPAALAGRGSGSSTAERDAVAYALSKHVVLVAPGGDGGAGTDPVNYPAAYPGVISVGAFSQAFNKAAFTSRHSYVTLTAAGDGVAAATLPTGYAMLHSTSAASAVVAGMAALIKAQFPNLTPAQVTTALTSSTVFRPKGGRLDGSGYGTADAEAALLAAAKINAAVPAKSGTGAAVAAPSSPVVHPRTAHLARTLRYAALGVAAVLLLALLIFALTRRARRRRARASRLAPLRDVARVAVRAQPEFSAVPPSAGSQFAGAAEYASAQFALEPFPGDLDETPFPGDERTRNPFPGDEEATTQFSISQFPSAEMPGVASFPAGEMPGAAPFPAAEMPPGVAPFPAVPPANGAAGGTHRALSPTPRPSAARPPRISGTPPWEAAEKPEGEVPWASSPPAKSAHNRPGPPRRVVPSGVQPWGPAAPSGAPQDGSAHGGAPGGSAQGGSAQGGSARAGRSQSDLPQRRGVLGGRGVADPFSDDPGSDGLELGSRVPGSMPLPAATQGGRHATDANGTADDESSKLYVWNPAEVTEAFPKVPPSESGRTQSDRS